MSINIKVLATNEISAFCELIKVFELTFEIENYKRPNITHLQNLLSKDYFIAIVAINNQKVVAGLTLYLLEQYHSEKTLVYLYDLAVLEEFQRQGIGKQLIQFTNDFCRTSGFEEVFVQADIEDEHAIEFYRATQPAIEGQFIQFSYFLKES